MVHRLALLSQPGGHPPHPVKGRRWSLHPWARRDEKIPGSSSSTCFFHWLIWLAWRPYSLDSSFTVFSPLIASRATLALKSAPCRLRYIFLLISVLLLNYWAATLSYSSVQFSGYIILFWLGFKDMHFLVYGLDSRPLTQNSDHSRTIGLGGAASAAIAAS